MGGGGSRIIGGSRIGGSRASRGGSGGWRIGPSRIDRGGAPGCQSAGTAALPK
jgi:hypothetical protein